MKQGENNTNDFKYDYAKFDYEMFVKKKIQEEKQEEKDFVSSDSTLEEPPTAIIFLFFIGLVTLSTLIVSTTPTFSLNAISNFLNHLNQFFFTKDPNTSTE